MINSVLQKIKNLMHSSKMEKKWRELNSHNSTFLQWIPKNNTFFDNVKVGKYTYGPIRAIYSDHPDEKLLIGNYCSIGSGTTFILGSEHSYKGISTFPFKVKCLGYTTEAYTKGPIVLEDDVWIGEDTLLLSGVTVGKGAVVGARSLVVNDVPPYAIVGGVPARVIKYRFDKDVIKLLSAIDWSKIDDSRIKKCEELLYEKIDINNVQDIINKLGI